MITRSAIAAKALELCALRIPFAHGQASRFGSDCIGLIRLMGTELGLFDGSSRNPAIRKHLGYGREPLPEKMRAALDEFLDHVQQPSIACDRSLALPPLGSVIWVKLTSETPPRHIAVVTGLPGQLVHLPNQKPLTRAATAGVLISHCSFGHPSMTHSMMPEWEIVGTWDFRGVAQADHRPSCEANKSAEP